MMLQEQVQRKANSNDKRAFWICPKCKGEEINRIVKYERGTQFKGKQRIAEITVITCSITVCRGCCYSVETKTTSQRKLKRFNDQ